MQGFPPQLIALLCILFIALGIFNILMARRRQLREGVQQRQPWYKQVSVLTGIEYILLALVFLLSISISYKWLPSSLNGFLFPFFIVLLLASGVLAGFVIYQGMANVRRRRAGATHNVQESSNNKAYVANDGQRTTVDTVSAEEREQYQQRRRARRQKAAVARRRRAGRA